jgi:HSP20 family molecular chaperone IbpA
MISKTVSITIIVLIMLLLSATLVVADQTSVTINSPELADGDFSVTMEIENVVDLDSGQFNLYFNPDDVNVTGVGDGDVDGTAIPIADWVVAEDNVQVLFNLPGIDGVSGSGSLATIHFETIVPGACSITISNGLLVSNMAETIPASWDGVESEVTAVTETVSATQTIAPTDVAEHETETETELETPGFGALFVVGVLAAIYLARRRD